MDHRDSLDRSSSEIVSGELFANGSSSNGGAEPQTTLGVPHEASISPFVNDTLSTIDEILKSDVRLFLNILKIPPDSPQIAISTLLSRLKQSVASARASSSRCS